MGVISTILTVLIILASILLIIVVLLQNGKGGGIASNFVSANQAFGVRQTADFLEKLTWGLVSFILVASVITSLIYSSNKSAGTADAEEIEEEEADITDVTAADEDSTIAIEDVEAAPEATPEEAPEVAENPEA